MSATIRWLGQAGFILRTDEGSLAVDPFCGEARGNAQRLYATDVDKGGIRVDMVLTTHTHWDHFDPVTYRDYVRPNLIVGPGSCMKALENTDLSIEGIRLDQGESLERCGFHITAVEADHLLDSVGYVVCFDKIKLYFSGDALFTSKTIMPNARMKPDIAFICINGKLGNMNFREAATYCHILGARVGVPTHYDMIRHNTENPKEFTDAIPLYAPDTKAFVMERGVEYSLCELLNM